LPISKRQQRKGVFRLMFLALAVFALTLATRGGDERTANPETPAIPLETVEVRVPGARAMLPAASPSGDAVAAEEFLAAARPDIEVCLRRWWMLQPGLQGTVRIGVDVGPAGLGRAWVEDVESVEEPVAACLSEVLWSQPVISEADSTLTWSFEVE